MPSNIRVPWTHLLHETAKGKSNRTPYLPHHTENLLIYYEVRYKILDQRLKSTLL
jgi:hypothetical protein